MQDQAQQQDQQIQLGFEKALTMTNPEWRTAFTAEQVNLFRHFYHQGIQDMNFLNVAAHQNAAANFQSLLHTAVVTGNEEMIAKLQAEQQEAAGADKVETDGVIEAKADESEAPAPVSKSQAKRVAAQKAKPAKGKKK